MISQEEMPHSQPENVNDGHWKLWARSYNTFILCESESQLTIHIDASWFGSVHVETAGNSELGSILPHASINQMVGCIKANNADVRGERTQLDFQVQGERGNL